MRVSPLHALSGSAVDDCDVERTLCDRVCLGLPRPRLRKPHSSHVRARARRSKAPPPRTAARARRLPGRRRRRRFHVDRVGARLDRRAPPVAGLREPRKVKASMLPDVEGQFGGQFFHGPTRFTAACAGTTTARAPMPATRGRRRRAATPTRSPTLASNRRRVVHESACSQSPCTNTTVRSGLPIDRCSHVSARGAPAPHARVALGFEAPARAPRGQAGRPPAALTTRRAGGGAASRPRSPEAPPRRAGRRARRASPRCR